LIPNEALERARADRVVKALGLVTRSIDTEVRDLSGGNAQKVVFGKWLDGAARVLLLDDPTVGVDVGAKSDILELIRGFARDGKAVLIASSDFEELVAVSDRILVIAQGQIVAEVPAAGTTDHDILRMASGLLDEPPSTEPPSTEPPSTPPVQQPADPDGDAATVTGMPA
jgi:ribose transport system ATP-binding protein